MQLDEAVALDERARIVTAERDDARRRVNELSKQVGQLRRAGDVDKADLVMAESRAVGDAESGLAADLADVEQELQELLLRIPNLPSELAPDGLSDADNPVVKGPINLPDTFPAHQRVPTGRRPPPSASSTTRGRQDQQRDVHDATRARDPRVRCASSPSTATPTPSRRSARPRSSPRPPSRRQVSSPSSPTTRCGRARRPLVHPTAEVPLTSIGAWEILAEADLPVA